VITVPERHGHTDGQTDRRHSVAQPRSASNRGVKITSTKSICVISCQTYKLPNEAILMESISTADPTNTGNGLERVIISMQ